VNRPLKLVFAVIPMLWATFSFASTTDFWITQGGAGAANGSSLSNAASCGGPGQSTCAAFNSASNWGSGAAQIGPGTTIHLSGTFTAAANACNYMQFQSSGTSGNPITVHFESGAVLTAPTWGSGCYAIYSSGHNYITVDGGNTGCALFGSPTASASCTSQGTFTGGGTIQATANGTGLAYQANTAAIGAYNCSNCTFENLIISDIYVHTCNGGGTSSSSCSDENGDPTGAIYIDGGSNVIVTNNIAHDMKWCIEDNFNNGDTNVQFYGNQVYNVDHGFVIANSGTDLNFTYGYVYNNWYHDPQNWDDAGNNNHHDGVHFWATGTGVSLTHSYVYNNLFSGNFGYNMNSGVYQENLGYNIAACDAWVFNNVLAPSAGVPTGNGLVGLGANGGVGCWSSVNNTLVGYNTTNATAMNANTTAGTSYNNIVNIVNGAISGYNVDGGAIDYQDYYTIGSGGWNGGGPLSVWVSYCQANFVSTLGCDAHSISTNPNLSSAFVPNSGSPVIAKGKSLYSTCNGEPNPGLGALCYDAAGNARPSSGSWDLGAFQYSSTPAPAAPSGLAAVVE
jgi:hypothetical protein